MAGLDASRLEGQVQETGAGIHLRPTGDDEPASTHYPPPQGFSLGRVELPGVDSRDHQGLQGFQTLDFVRDFEHPQLGDPLPFGGSISDKTLNGEELSAGPHTGRPCC